VIVSWAASEADRQALAEDEESPFFASAHFDGHLSVLVRASRLGELTLAELTEVVQDAWVCRPSSRRASQWLSAHQGQLGRNHDGSHDHGRPSARTMSRRRR